MPSEPTSPEPGTVRLSPDEVGEILRRYGMSGARFEGRPTVEEVAARCDTSPVEILRIVGVLRSLGAEIDAPSGDLERLRIEAQDLERPEEDPRAQARVAAEETAIRMEGGAGKLPRATRFVLILGAILFVVLVAAYVTRTPPGR